jgi:hypothetical protein
MAKTSYGPQSYFKLTRSAIRSYKKDDPLETTRNPRPEYFRWDVNWGIGMWFATVLLILLAMVADIILLPFQLVFGKNPNTTPTPPTP